MRGATAPMWPPPGTQLTRTHPQLGHGGFAFSKLWNSWLHAMQYQSREIIEHPHRNTKQKELIEASNEILVLKINTAPDSPPERAPSRAIHIHRIRIFTL